MIIQAQDYKFYSNPIIYGEGWYVSFEERPELTCRGKISARTALAASGVAATLSDRLEADRRIFPGTIVLQPVKVWTIKVKAPIPVPTLFKQGPMTECSGPEVMVWYRWFDADIIRGLLEGKNGARHLDLGLFVLGRVKAAGLEVDKVLKRAATTVRRMNMGDLVGQSRYLIRSGNLESNS